MTKSWPRIFSIVPEAPLGKLVRLPLRLLPKKLVLPVFSGINKGFKWRVGSHIHGAWIGSYEREKQQACVRLVSPGATVYDIGAQAGFYSLAFSRLAHAGRVYAFEPLAENCVNLLDHLRLNKVANVIVHQMAVSDQSGIVSFRIASNNAMGSLTIERSDYRVYAVTLDELIQGQIMPVPDLVKMDVEGSEAGVLRGAAQLVRERRTVWLVALHGRQPTQECWDIFRSSGYSIFRIDGTKVMSVTDMPDEICAMATPEQPRGR